GKAEGKAEAVLVLLGRKGEVPSDVESAIRAQTDTAVLTEWLLLAANVKTVGEFQEQMGSISGK
ncbi:MAG TPA: 3-isopropylmalate dehydrogenase, partial [Lachnospiraceae bacterium]|nr:3-isopropylmalate dehydrogenase [Lachnospiraceae bacterium]